MTIPYRIINLKEGLTTLDEARRRLAQELRCSPRPCIVKLIHGYGSTEKGGVVRVGIRKALFERKKKGEVRLFIEGEKFGMFDPASRELKAMCDSVADDGDWNNVNPGVTIVLL